MSANRIDVHHHLVTPAYSEALSQNGGDPSGFPTPAWSLSADEEFCDAAGIGTVIFSLTAPGPSIAKGDTALKLARDTNEYLASLRDKSPSRYGFFAAIPSLTDTSAALAEIVYALDVLKADGITLFTRYGPGNMYLGHALFKPIWQALNERHAVVFVHPTHAVDTTLVSPSLPQPIVDYPHETTRTAIDLVISNTKRENPNCKIILSHAGGTLPYIAKRAASLADTALTSKSWTEILEDIASFYFDLALSLSKQVIQLLLVFTTPDHIMYGSDFPYASQKTIRTFLSEFDKAELDHNLANAINRGNAKVGEDLSMVETLSNLLEDKEAENAVRDYLEGLL